jgi:hypothetical protein
LPDDAREKKIERLLREFEARLYHCLRNGDIREGFSDDVNKKLTNTSKYPNSKRPC